MLEKKTFDKTARASYYLELYDQAIAIKVSGLENDNGILINKNRRLTRDNNRLLSRVKALEISLQRLQEAI